MVAVTESVVSPPRRPGVSRTASTAAGTEAPGTGEGTVGGVGRMPESDGIVFVLASRPVRAPTSVPRVVISAVLISGLGLRSNSAQAQRVRTTRKARPAIEITTTLTIVGLRCSTCSIGVFSSGFMRSVVVIYSCQEWLIESLIEECGAPLGSPYKHCARWLQHVP